MKNAKHLLLSIFTLSLLVIAGCETVPQDTKLVTPGTAINTDATTSATDLMTASNGQSGGTQAEGINPDQTAYDMAISLTDASFCTKINATDKASACEQAVSDQNKFNEAIYANDQALCDSIVSNELKQSCQIRVEGNRAFTQKQAQAEMELKSQYETYSQLINSGKVEDCANSLQDPSFVANCEATIITNTAIMAQDASKCTAIKSTNDSEECQKVVESL